MEFIFKNLIFQEKLLKNAQKHNFSTMKIMFPG